ncbi:NAD(P)-binding protein [Gyrodon lividus]|nr:NAD(P)-binding protein [Gyrodon lividus]
MQDWKEIGRCREGPNIFLGCFVPGKERKTPSPIQHTRQRHKPDVNAVTSELKPEELEILMASVFHRLSSGSDYASPHRTSISTSRHTTLFMPSQVPDLGTTIKVVSVPRSPGDKQGLPASTLVLDEMTGCVKAIVNASTLTALRTAAGSVLATRLLISKAPKTLVAFGAGQQIEAHVDLHLRAFPSLEYCTIVNRTNNTRLQNLLSFLRQSHPFKTFNILTLDDEQLKDAVGNADIICTATSSSKPLFSSEWVSPGAHLNLVGSFTPNMHEVDSKLINRAGKVVVDSRDACTIEAGELIAAGKAENPKESMIELGELVEKGDDGRFVPVALPGGLKGPDAVTIFKSVGVGLQDVAIASVVVSRAQQMGRGTIIDNYHP